MSETPEQPAEIPTKPTGIAWGDDISEDRLAELKELFERQQVWAEQPRRDMEPSVFNGVKLTGADVFWLAAMALAEQEDGDLDKAAMKLCTERNLSNPFSLSSLHLEGVDLHEARLGSAFLPGVNLRRARLNGAELGFAHLGQAILDGAQLENANLNIAYLENASLCNAKLQHANLLGAMLQRALLRGAQMQGAELSQAKLQKADLSCVAMAGADLHGASLDKETNLKGANLEDVSLDLATFDNANLTVIPWEKVHHLGDEHEARAQRSSPFKAMVYLEAARAYRTLSVALRTQGLGIESARFHYRSELMERKSNFWHMLTALRSRRFQTAPAYFGRWLFSWLLGTFAGYGDCGDYFGRLLLTYVLVVSAFAGLMFLAPGRVVSRARRPAAGAASDRCAGDADGG